MEASAVCARHFYNSSVAATNMKMLITYPESKNPGGVSNYWKNLRGEFGISTVHFTIGKRTEEKGLLTRIRRSLADYRRFLAHLKSNEIDLVQINPSLDPKSFARDGILALSARACGKKTVVFFHGWQKPFEKRISRGFSWIFKLLFGWADAFIVLSDAFGKKLETWGVTKPIYREVTVLSNDSLKGLNMQEVLRKRHETGRFRILFLSRILRSKGIYETVQAVSLLQARYPNVELVIAGEGAELDNVKSFAREVGASNVIFPGYVKGQEKRRLFEQANIYCLQSYSEGFPVSVVEAMAFGLPVITRPVGGLVDFFKDGEHGFMSDSLEPTIVANMIERLLLDKALCDRISLTNYRYAQEHFSASDAAARLERIYSTLLDSR